MKHLYDSKVTLKTDTRVMIEANYNRTVFGMAKPGEVLYYQSPDDPEERPLYVDAEGRPVPVSTSTLQPMYNSATGRVVDKNGVEVPAYDTLGYAVHIDDVRVAIASTEYAVTDEEGKEIFIAHDGEIIPTNEHGIPNTTLVGGEVWVVGSDGQPYAPLNRVYSLNSYVKPVRAENVPVDSSGVNQPLVEDIYPDYFDINSIVKADRPHRRGVQVAWASADEHGTPITAGIHAYDNARFYTASKDMAYKYWTSPETSSATGTPSGGNMSVFDNSWTVVGGTSTSYLTNQITSNIQAIGTVFPTRYFQKRFALEDTRSYEMSFDALAPHDTQINVWMFEWTDDQPGSLDFNSPSMLPPKKIYSTMAPAGVSTPINFDIQPSPSTVTHAIRIGVNRSQYVADPKVSVMNLNVSRVSFEIAGVGPRAMYDKPIDINKIVIGVDYSIDETKNKNGSFNSIPSTHSVRVYTDRGDGLFHWQTVSLNPEIDDDGKITLYFDGSSWGDNINTDSTVRIMGVQYLVHAMRRRDARVNIMEISARRVYDVSDLLMEYSVDSDASDTSFVLPFGSVNSNRGSVELSNHDGRFNHENRYLLDRERSMEAGSDVFTSVPNPFYRMLGERVTVEIETATYEPGSTEEKDYIRILTAKTSEDINPGSSMSARIELRDDSIMLENIIPRQVFYSSPSMSIIQVLYMLLDSIGFTAVKFADEDEHFATHLNYFWVKKEDDNLWSIISDICRATQTVAYFDEYNHLNFKSLKGMYESALANKPAQLFTTENVSGVLANIKSMDLESSVSTNKVTVNYRETSEPEKTPSGAYPMEVVWEPEGTQVLRSANIMENLNNKIPSKGGSSTVLISADAARTWPYETLVQIEGEFIRLGDKQYRYYLPNGEKKFKYISNEDERKELDRLSGDQFERNAFTGRVKIKERGAEETAVKSHKINSLSEFTRRYRTNTSSVKENYSNGVSIKNSKLYIKGNSSIPWHGTVTITEGIIYDRRLHHMGTRLNITSGTTAGVCFGMNSPGEDGIFVEIATTENIEAIGRTRGELSMFVRKDGRIKRLNSIEMPISKNREYDLDVSTADTSVKRHVVSYSKYYNITLRYGNRGSNVKVLQGALNKLGEKLAVDGSFGPATRSAVIRLQRKNGLAQDAIVRKEEWQKLENIPGTADSIVVTSIVDGTFFLETVIPYASLPNGWNGGRFGVFARGNTNVNFEYMYGIHGGEDIEPDESNFYDYVRGGYVSDQLDAGWIYDTKREYIKMGGKKQWRKNVTNQLLMHDFGPYLHEIREFDVAFEDDEPALSSYPYFSNTNHVHILDYMHRPFGAKFTLANKARWDAVLQGEDVQTFGSENSIDHVFMIYGTKLKINDERSLTVANKTSIAARGVEELDIDVDWIQSKDSAEKLASHIVEAMSYPVPTYTLEIFGNAGIKVGQIVSVYNPRQGVGNSDDPVNGNRYFVYSVSQSNSGGQSTTIGVREVIGGQGIRAATLSDVLAKNNNAANMNPGMDDYEFVGSGARPSGYDYGSGVTANHVTPINPKSPRGSAMRINGTGATAGASYVRLNPYPANIGRFPHPMGEYFVFSVSVTAPEKNHGGIGLAVEGWPTSGSRLKDFASIKVALKPGETRRVTLKGRFLTDSNIPEVEAMIRILDPKNLSAGGKSGQSIIINDAYYRTSPTEENLYPLYGGAEIRKG